MILNKTFIAGLVPDDGLHQNCTLKYCRINKKREKSTLSASVHVIFLQLFDMRVEKAIVFLTTFSTWCFCCVFL